VSRKSPQDGWTPETQEQVQPGDPWRDPTPDEDARTASAHARARLGDTFLRPTDRPVADREPLSRKEVRRLAVEAFMDAHYEVRCDGALELAWFEAHPEQAAAIVSALDAARSRPDEAGLRAAIEAAASEGRNIIPDATDDDAALIEEWAARTLAIQPAVPVAGAEAARTDFDVLASLVNRDIEGQFEAATGRTLDEASANHLRALRAAQPEDDRTEFKRSELRRAQELGGELAGLAHPEDDGLDVERLARAWNNLIAVGAYASGYGGVSMHIWRAVAAEYARLRDAP
jgi:hypothetical protein